MHKRVFKEKILKIMNTPENKNKNERFIPTINQVIRWYNTLNENIFNGKLPKTINCINIKKTRGYWAETVCEGYKKNCWIGLTLSDYFTSLKHFLTCLAHEMIHIWEYKTYETMAHGKRFFSWQERFQRYGLPVSIKS